MLSLLATTNLQFQLQLHHNLQIPPQTSVWVIAQSSPHLAFKVGTPLQDPLR